MKLNNNSNVQLDIFDKQNIYFSVLDAIKNSQGSQIEMATKITTLIITLLSEIVNKLYESILDEEAIQDKNFDDSKNISSIFRRVK